MHFLQTLPSKGKSSLFWMNNSTICCKSLYFQVYKQKVKHLLYEHQNNISELKGESTVALKLAQDENRSNELDLRKDKRSLKVELKEQELAHEDVIKNLKKVSLGVHSL